MASVHFSLGQSNHYSFEIMNLGMCNLMVTIEFSATNEWHCLFLLIGASRASSHSSSAK